MSRTPRQGATRLPSWVCCQVWQAGSGYNHLLRTTVRTAQATGRATCRCCGQTIAQGEDCYDIWYPFDDRADVRPELLTRCYLHSRPCTDGGGGR